MLLAIDIGNSNIVIGCMNGMQIENEFRIATDFVKTSDQYCIDLKNVLSLCDIHVQDLEGVIISSVVPPLLNSFRSAVMKLTGKKPMVVGPGIRTGLNIQIDNPAQIGSDLIVAAVAALHEYSAPLMVVDMGTATTISVIDRSRTYIGGCICPHFCRGAFLESGASAGHQPRPAKARHRPQHNRLYAQRHYARSCRHARRSH